MKRETQNDSHVGKSPRHILSISWPRCHVVTFLTRVNRKSQSSALFFVYATKCNQSSGRNRSEPEARRRQPDVCCDLPGRGLASPDAAAPTYSYSADDGARSPPDRRWHLRLCRIKPTIPGTPSSSGGIRPAPS